MDALEAIFTRRSIRNYLDRPVETEKVQLLLKAAMIAPTTVDNRDWEFMVLTQRERLDQLSGCLNQSGKALCRAPLAIVLCGNTDEAYRWAPDYWVEDCAAAAENILIAANSMGLGAVWLGVYRRLTRCGGYPNFWRSRAMQCPSVLLLGYPGRAAPRTGRSALTRRRCTGSSGELEKRNDHTNRGRRAMTLKEIAAQTGYSIATVSRVLNKTGSTATASKAYQEITRFAEEMGYKCAAKKGGLVAVVIPDIENPLFGAIVKTVQELGREDGLDVIVVNTNESAEQEAHALTIPGGHGPNLFGMIYTPVSEVESREFMVRDPRQHSGVPVILVDRDLRFASYDSVFINNVVEGI